MPEYFRGWYFRCRSASQALAVIPAIHRTGRQRTCSIQLITDQASWNIPFPASAFRKNGHTVEIGGNRFERQGFRLQLSSPALSASGSVAFGPFTPIRYDIMGPFRYVPFMECRHSVFSMKHSVDGEILVNGVPYVFRGADGYLEGDRGRSFPKAYAWTQCAFPEGALMLSVAEIPLGRLRFTGVIGVILLNGKEYRLATYLGAEAVEIRKEQIIIRQGDARLTVNLLAEGGQPLRAPVGGAMTRIIREHAACQVFYRFQKGGRTLLELESPGAAFEYEYPQ